MEAWKNTDLAAATIGRGCDLYNPTCFAKMRRLGTPPKETDELIFIADAVTRDRLRRDVGAVNTSLMNAEWKAATVLGGAAIEALLHWKLSPPQTDSAILESTVTEAVNFEQLSKRPKTNPDDWYFHEFTVVAFVLGVIRKDTLKQALTARDYRNLIHPGNAARNAMTCDRGTALAVVSGLEHVIRDLSRSRC